MEVFGFSKRRTKPSRTRLPLSGRRVIHMHDPSVARTLCGRKIGSRMEVRAATYGNVKRITCKSCKSSL